MQWCRHTLSALLAVVFVLSLAACSSSKNNGSAGASAGSGAASSTAGKADSGSPACRFATGFAKSLLDLALSVPPNTVDLAGSGSSGELKRYIDAEVRGSAAAVSGIQKLSTPNGFKQLQADIVAIYKGMNDTLLQAQQALAQGNNQRANDLLNQANTALTSGSAVTDLDTKYPQQTAQLNACPNN